MSNIRNHRKSRQRAQKRAGRGVGDRLVERRLRFEALEQRQLLSAVSQSQSAYHAASASPALLAQPSLVTTPTPTTVTLGTTATTLTDSAVLSGGSDPTGTITFTLYYNGGATPVDTETATVNGNGAYTTPTGYALPTTGTVTGTYQWDASYGGDTNNNSASDNNDPAEQVTVSPAQPSLVATPSPTVFVLPNNGRGGGGGLPGDDPADSVSQINAATSALVGSATNANVASLTGSAAGQGETGNTLRDSAVLSGGYNETGTITFTLFYNGGTTPVDTETAAVDGDGTYTTPTGYTLPTTGAVTGTYQWNASYSGDGNNALASDDNDPSEQVTVSPAQLALSGFPDPITVAPGPTAITLTDTAYLSGGYYESGTITFTLVAPGGSTVDTETAAVNSDGVYTTPTGYTLPLRPTAGTYQWNLSYSGDANNDSASDNNDPFEQVTVAPPIAPTFTADSPPAAAPVGEYYSYQFQASGTDPIHLFGDGSARVGPARLVHGDPVGHAHRSRNL